MHSRVAKFLDRSGNVAAARLGSAVALKVESSIGFMYLAQDGMGKRKLRIKDVICSAFPLATCCANICALGCMIGISAALLAQLWLLMRVDSMP